jgi:25S rRNA (adenine2142-N1)-methyltransferase
MESTAVSSEAKRKPVKNRRLASSKAPQKRLAPLPSSKSRKRARKITTLFHRYTQLKEAATTADEQNRIDTLIEEIGGKSAYQKASQVSTSYHSTSKWVLSYLAQNGWLYGMADDKGLCLDVHSATVSETNQIPTRNDRPLCDGSVRRRKTKKRDTRLLEIGAINTELLDAASASNLIKNKNAAGENEQQQAIVQKKYRLHVRSIDLHSMHDRIEEVDFLSLPISHCANNPQLYDVIVCSMVLNYLPTAEKRGEMLLRISHFLRPGGIVFITIPKTCLNLSPYIDEQRFTQLLRDIGLDAMEHAKDTPKIAFFIGKKSVQPTETLASSKWQSLIRFRHGRKFRNEFAVSLPQFIRECDIDEKKANSML